MGKARIFLKELHSLLPPKIATILDFELGNYRSFWRIFSDKKNLSQKIKSGLAFNYGEMQNGMLWMVQFLSVSEIVAIELLVSNEKLRIFLLILGILTILLILGFWASFKTNPHDIDDEYLNIRQGSLYQIKIPKFQISEINGVVSREHSKCQLIDGILHLPVMNETNAQVKLLSPIYQSLPWGIKGAIKEINFYINDAKSSVPKLIQVTR
ncbi:MAG: hypothetical protein HW379_67 [Actinobacteria bacterium]|jgi:hypothetical protein|nr:hypothetical protein [Actinomycetota bacterium]